MTKFSIVMATYNSEATLHRCLESVREIKVATSCKVILIDGASNDSTLSIAGIFSDIIDVLVSEPDTGVYDAWNKGLKYCTNPWVMFLGSDDYICVAEFLDYLSFVETLSHCDFVSCRVQLIDEEGKAVREAGRPWEWPLFRKYMCT